MAVHEDPAPSLPVRQYAGSPIEAENRRLLTEAAALSDTEVLTELVSRHPQLLNAYVLRQELDRIPEPERILENQAFRVVALLDRGRNLLESNPERYPLGHGPIEPIWTAVTQRYMSRPEAARHAATPDVVWRVSGAYLRALCRTVTRLVQDEARRADGWDLQELVLATVQALPTVDDSGEVGRMAAADFAYMYDETAGDWLLTTLVQLGAVPDGRIYRRGQAIAANLVQRFQARGERQRAGRALHRVASLGVDPYNGLPVDEEVVRRELRRRLTGALDAAEARELDWAEADMPPPLEALTVAERQYREATALRVGHESGLSAKGHLETLYGLRSLGREVADEELLTTARTALAKLDPDRSEQHILSIHTMLREAGLAVGESAAALPPDGGVPDASGPDSSEAHFRELELGLQRARQVGAEQREKALWILVGLHTYADTLGDVYRERLWREEVSQLANIVRHGSPRVRRGPLARHDRRPLTRLAGAVDRALRLQRDDREQEALDELAGAPSVADLGTEWQKLSEPLRFCAMGLSVGAAVNAVPVDPAAAVRRYAKALEHAGGLRLAGTVADLLRRMGWLARDAPGAAVAFEICVALLPVALPLIRANPQIRYEFQHTCLLAFAAGARSDIDARTADVLRQMVKGLSFAVALRRDARYSPVDDPDGRRLLAEIEGLEVTDPAAGHPLFDQDTLLTTYVNSREVRPGANPEERLANLQRAFDERVFERLVGGGDGGHGVRVPGLALDQLDDRTAVLDLLLGLDVDGQLVVYTWFHTSAGTHLLARRSADLPGAPVWHGDNRELLVHPLAAEVRAVRQSIQDYPGLGRPVSSEGAEALRAMADQLFGDGGELLDLAAAGRDRLIVVPHGPLHFLPFHLLPLGDLLLADVFTVSILPNRELLHAAPAPPAERSATSLGLSFGAGEPFGLPPLTASEREVREVADCFGTGPVLDSAATEQAFVAALRSSRYVHLSTHGRNSTAGAAFQLLYLWPAGDSDGRLHAFELLDLDLHGLEVVSLSACETALGRFDLLDNLRGLPASLLLRGVRTLIGTLWEAEVDASSTFFTSFYAHLRTDPDDVAAAFRSARDVTRQRHPAYRDWGAFYLMGAS
ncbi:CHAT domain-containing protein [Plantactinospora endophytica]|uniref:CHAT domain-containing protein n=1 Tax=Plantactinospora endophytica TaxID=673535 RepID=A0ABQ4E056_9ACTN|nr:CHAT domain-containing protein [Plantactinospora endophytica]GIG88089.1 hypothetical protein Pen02_30250 [Plantactinospora endophytica]